MQIEEELCHFERTHHLIYSKAYFPKALAVLSAGIVGISLLKTSFED
jgi:hypothetical protein